MLVRCQLPGDGPIPMGANQFRAIALSGAGKDGAAHQRYLRAVAGSEVSKPETMPHFVRDGALLPFRRHLRKPGVIHGDQACRVNDLGAGRVGSDTKVVVEPFNLNRRGCEPQPPQGQRNQHHVLQHGSHATPASQART